MQPTRRQRPGLHADRLANRELYRRFGIPTTGTIPKPHPGGWKRVSGGGTMNLMKRDGRHIMACGLCALAWGLAGCANPAIRERSARRVERIHQTLALAQERESRSPANMKWTLDVSAKREAQSPANLDRDLVGTRIRRDVEQWPDRQMVHGAWLADLFDGNPASI